MSAESKHLVVVISGHGYGHAGMTAPLIQALQRMCSNLRITVRADLPEHFLRTIMPFEFDHCMESTDFGMVMFDAFRINTEKSLTNYQALHQNWQTNIDAEINRLTQLQADFVISNIAYLPLAAAKQIGIPAIAYGCLNWAEIFQHYFSGHNQIYSQILNAYDSADCIIRTQPAMPMTGLATQTVGPVALAGSNRHQFLCEKLALADNTQLVLASMGGIKTDINIKAWPVIEGVQYLIDGQAPDERDDVSSLLGIDISFIDALCSADLFLTKPGYGSFSQAACNRTAVLYVERPDWPEQSYLCDWLKHHIPCANITQQQFSDGHFASELISLLEQEIPPTMPYSGLDDAIRILLNKFDLTEN